MAPSLSFSIPLTPSHKHTYTHSLFLFVYIQIYICIYMSPSIFTKFKNRTFLILMLNSLFTLFHNEFFLFRLNIFLLPYRRFLCFKLSWSSSQFYSIFPKEISIMVHYGTMHQSKTCYN